MEEYIEKLISQIRCKKARPYIEDEIRGHIEDQISDNLSSGMTKEEAIENAVKDMGDPIEVGISMDKIHKPKIAWNILLIVGLVSVLAIVVQYLFVLRVSGSLYNPLGVTRYTEVIGEFDDNGGHVSHAVTYMFSIGEFVRTIIVGFVVMGMIYFLDYTFIAKYSKILGMLIIGTGIYTIAFATPVNGTRYYILGLVGVSAAAVMMFYIPLYGAIIYKYRGGGIGAIIKSIVWLIIPVFIAMQIPSLITSVIMLVSMLTQLTIAICKGWFKVNIKGTVLAVWSAFLLLPIAGLFGMFSLHLLRGYQEARIRAWLNVTNDENYLLSIIRNFAKDVPMFGKSRIDIFGQLPDLNRDYILAYVLNSYGSIAGLMIIAVLTVLIAFIFGNMIKQKNELGLTMGIGCGMILLLNASINILCSIGVLPPTASFLPFFSAGGSNTILCYALIGIVLSIYKYKDVYPKDVSVKISLKRNIRMN